MVCCWSSGAEQLAEDGVVAQSSRRVFSAEWPLCQRCARRSPSALLHSTIVVTDVPWQLLRGSSVVCATFRFYYLRRRGG